MGKIMREMWANIDGFTKTVFNELADVGRMRYRTLMAEYKLPPQEQSASPKQSQVASNKAMHFKGAAPFVASNDTGAVTYPMNINETPKATKNDFSFTSTTATSSATGHGANVTNLRATHSVVMTVPTAMGPKNSLRRLGSQSSIESMSDGSVDTSHCYYSICIYS